MPYKSRAVGSAAAHRDWRLVSEEKASGRVPVVGEQGTFFSQCCRPIMTLPLPDTQLTERASASLH